MDVLRDAAWLASQGYDVVAVEPSSVPASFATPEAWTLSISRSGFGVCRRARAPRLFLIPSLQRRVCFARIAFERFVAHDGDREFEAYAVWVEKIDRVDELVVGDPDNLDAVRFKSQLHRVERLKRRHLEGDVIDPRGRVG